MSFMPYVPQKDDGRRMEPPWSPPIAISTSPAATRAAEPEEEPPVVCAGFLGFRVGPWAQVWLPPEVQKFSHTALPKITPPASRIRVTIVASTSGTYPSRMEVPAAIGTPARQTLSLRTTVRRASGPSGAP